MQRHLRRYLSFFQQKPGQDTALPHTDAASDIAVFQITVISDISALCNQTVMRRVPPLSLSVCADLLVPVQIFIIFHPIRHQFQQFSGRPEMNKLRRRKAENLHPKIMQRLPDIRSAVFQFFAKAPLRRLQIILLQRRVLRQRIQKVTVKTDSCPVIDKSVKFFVLHPIAGCNQRKQRTKKLRIQHHRAGIQIHHSLFIDGAEFSQLLFGLFMQKPLYHPPPVI